MNNDKPENVKGCGGEISIIIPSFNGAYKLPVVLSAIAAQTVKPLEIIVVVDGSTDNTKQVLESEKIKYENLKIIFQDNGGRAKVRNTGASAAIGDLLIFFDDDMIPDVKCIEEHKKKHLEYFGVIVTGAQIDYHSDESSDFQKFKSFLSLKWSIPLIKEAGEPLGKDNFFVTAANFSIPRILFLELGGFDEKLQDSEDFELAVRAFKRKVPIYYNHDAFAWHNDPMNCRKYVNRLREYTRSQQKLQSINPVRDQLLQRYMPPALPGIKRLLFYFFAANFWVWSVDHFNWLLVLPKKIRYKIYDFIITANGIYSINSPKTR